MNKKLGFTITEVIVVVAVLSVVLTLATPDLTKIFAKQSEMSEKIRLRKIHEALDIYAKKNKQLPNPATWASDLVEFIDLSEAQIEDDVWGTPRRYVRFSENINYLGSTYQVYYAAVSSAGIDRVNQAIMPSNKTTFGQFDFSVDSVNRATDDLAIKYTDQSNKLKLLDITLSRMEKLSLALEKYARVKQITGIDKYPDYSDQFIYFPEDRRSGDDGRYFKSGTKSSDNSVTLSLSAGEGIEVLSGNAMEATNLAELLGLPAEYGEDALTDAPMWYVSNPGPDGMNLCDNEREDAPYYPPVITVSASAPC